MRPEKLMTREEYKEWRTHNTNFDDCQFCDPGSQFILKEHPHWLWVMSIAPYRPFHTMFIPRRHVEEIQDLSMEEFVEFSMAHNEGRDHLRRLGHQRVLMFWRQRDDKVHKGTGAPNALHLHVHMMPDKEDMLNALVLPSATNMELYDRLVKQIGG